MAKSNPKPDEMRMIEGGCACRAVRYRVPASFIWAGYCHCTSCQSFASAPCVAWICVANVQTDFAGPLKYFVSSPGVKRGFCENCGTPISYQNQQRPEEIDIYARSLDDPAHFKPMFHVHLHDSLGWFKPDDQLPRYARSLEAGDTPKIF